MISDNKEHAPLWKRPQTARYVVAVDHQAKSSFDTCEAADQEARRISDGFPKVVVKVTDTESDSTKTFGQARALDGTDVADKT
jgi:hypothetical protein